MEQRPAGGAHVGIGANHQTGWTALVAKLTNQQARDERSFYGILASPTMCPPVRRALPSRP